MLSFYIFLLHYRHGLHTLPIVAAWTPQNHFAILKDKGCELTTVKRNKTLGS